MVINRHTNIKTEHESGLSEDILPNSPQDAHGVSKSGRVFTITSFQVNLLIVTKPTSINNSGLHEQTWGSARAMMDGCYYFGKA